MKPLSRIFLAFLLSFSSPFAQQREECAAALLSGDTHYRKFENRKALDSYELARKHCPRDYEPLWKMTRALNDVGEDIGGEEGEKLFADAMEFADTMQRRYPDSLQSYFLKAVAAGNLALSRKGTEQVKLARIIEGNSSRALRLDSTFAPAYVVLGVYYRKVATASSAEKTFANLFLGGIPDGTLKDSQRMLQKALRLDPGNVFAHVELGKTFLEMKRVSDAKKSLQSALSSPVSDHQDRRLKAQARQLLSTLK